MYLAQLKISNFRKLQNVELSFQPGLNVLVGSNNVGKTAVVDALRVLLAGHDEPYPRRQRLRLRVPSKVRRYNHARTERLQPPTMHLGQEG